MLDVPWSHLVISVLPAPKAGVNRWTEIIDKGENDATKKKIKNDSSGKEYAMMYQPGLKQEWVPRVMRKIDQNRYLLLDESATRELDTISDAEDYFAENSLLRLPKSSEIKRINKKSELLIVNYV